MGEVSRGTLLLFSSSPPVTLLFDKWLSISPLFSQSIGHSGIISFISFVCLFSSSTLLSFDTRFLFLSQPESQWSMIFCSLSLLTNPPSSQGHPSLREFVRKSLCRGGRRGKRLASPPREYLRRLRRAPPTTWLPLYRRLCCRLVLISMESSSLHLSRSLECWGLITIKKHVRITSRRSLYECLYECVAVGSEMWDRLKHAVTPDSS